MGGACTETAVRDNLALLRGTGKCRKWPYARCVCMCHFVLMFNYVCSASSSLLVDVSSTQVIVRELGSHFPMLLGDWWC